MKIFHKDLSEYSDPPKVAYLDPSPGPLPKNEFSRHCIEMLRQDIKGAIRMVNTMKFDDDPEPESDKMYPRTLRERFGEMYPHLNREQRDIVLKVVLDTMDGDNYLVVQNDHTPHIKEPMLLADICISRPLYWPGLDDGKRLLEEHKKFSDVQKLLTKKGMFRKGKVKSDFVVAYSLLRSDFGEEYIQVVNPRFLYRVMKGIVARRFAVPTYGDDQEEIEHGINRLKEVLPESLHPHIEPMRKEAEWTNLEIQRYSPRKV